MAAALETLASRTLWLWLTRRWPLRSSSLPSFILKLKTVKADGLDGGRCSAVACGGTQILGNQSMGTQIFTEQTVAHRAYSRGFKRAQAPDLTTEIDTV